MLAITREREFQSTRPRGARLEDLHGTRQAAGVSIHAPAWGATVVALHYHTVSFEVSIHAPAWGATSFLLIEFTRSGFVSIHAPAWGATRLWRSAAWWETVSIHAPAWGATQVLQRLLWALLVSIHAPAWGATPAGAGGWLSAGGFNPRARVGRDVRPRRGASAGTRFNPRARVGRDLPVLNASRATNSFNPRARVGRDSLDRSHDLRKITFQSTRPRGARPVLLERHGCLRKRFNPRARVGRDDGHGPTRPRVQGFNPRARVGRDVGFTDSTGGRSAFQSTRPRGARLGMASRPPVGRRVSIHAPAWGATISRQVPDV